MRPFANHSAESWTLFVNLPSNNGILLDIFHIVKHYFAPLKIDRISSNTQYPDDVSGLDTTYRFIMAGIDASETHCGLGKDFPNRSEGGHS